MTREEAIVRLKEGAPFSAIYEPVWEEALDMAIKALEQEPILDKIRAEIQDNRDEWIKGQDPEWHAYNRCLWIVDKYKAESEGET